MRPGQLRPTLWTRNVRTPFSLVQQINGANLGARVFEERLEQFVAERAQVLLPQHDLGYELGLFLALQLRLNDLPGR